MCENIRTDLVDFASEIDEAMGIIEMIRRGVFEAKADNEFVAWQSLADVGLAHCVEKLNAVAMGLPKLTEDRAES